MKFRHHLLATSALLAASIGVTAHAQTSGAAKAASTNTIEELVVTAQKREQSLQDVPVAVSAFTSEKRDLVGITTIADMTNFTPGLEYNAQNDRNTLRGVGRNTNVHAAQGSVAQYSDGVYTSSTVQAGESPLFIDRVEVLRGPQGTLYGRNSIAGAINIISKRPTDDPYAEVRGRYENYDHFLLEGAVSGPTAINGVDFRLAANWEKQTQGWFTNTVPGQPDQGNIIDTKLVEGQLKMKFNERFDGWMKLDWADWHNGAGGPGSGDTWSPVPFGLGEFGTTPIGPNNPGYACLAGTGVTNVQTPPGMTLAQACTNAATTDPRKFTSDTPYQVKLTGTMIFASEWNYHFDFADLKYIFGGTHYNYALTGPNPVGTAPIIAFQLPRVLPPGTPLGGGVVSPTTLVIPGGGPVVHPRGAFNYHEALNWVSHELDFASNDKGPLQWIGGLYYYDEFYVQPVYATVEDQGTATLPPLLANTCGFTGTCPALPPNNRWYDDRPEAETTSKAAFGQIDWKFMPDWKVTVGLRYSEDSMHGKESVRIMCYDGPACGVAPELLGSNFTLDLTQLSSTVSGYPATYPSGLPANPSGAGTPGVAKGVTSFTTVDPATGFATRTFGDKWSATTGTFGLQWEPDPSTNAYFTYSRGYKMGGFYQGITTTIGPNPETNPEHVNAYEVGLKKDFGRTIQTNLALFYYDYTNDQIPLSVANTSGAVLQLPQAIFYNIPGATSEGLELETIWQPIERLQILFNYSYDKTRITKGDGVVDPADPAALEPGAKPDFALSNCVKADGVTPSGNCSADAPTAAAAWVIMPNGQIVTRAASGLPVAGYQRPQSLVGGHLPNAPENKIAVNVNYTAEFDQGSLTGSISYVWRSKQYGSVFDRAYYTAPSYDQWDARLTFKPANNKFTVIAYIKNILNDVGYEGGAGASRIAGTIPGYVVGVGGPTQATPNGLTLVNVTQTFNTQMEPAGTHGIGTGYLLTPPRTYGIELQYRFW
jgi:iron complex outermembrane receptor protein